MTTVPPASPPPGTDPGSGAEVPQEALEGEVIEYLSVAEVADLAGVTARAVRKQITAGKLDAERSPDGSWRVPADAAERYRNGSGTSSTTRGSSGSQRFRDAGEVRHHGTAEFLELLHRHEGALVRLGQLEAERERLQLTAGQYEERAATAEAELTEVRDDLAAAQARVEALEAAEAARAAEPARRSWWPFGRSKGHTGPDSAPAGPIPGLPPTS
jgi:hypothetical protein